MQSGYYYSHCPECGLPASGGFTCGHTPKVASATPLDTKTVEDGMSDEKLEGIAVRFTGKNCISLLRWMGNPHWNNDMLHTTDNPYVETTQGPITAEMDDWVVKTDDGKLILCRPVAAKLPKPEDGIEAQQHYACVMEGVTHAANGFYARCHTAGCYWSTHTDCMTKEEAQKAADEHTAPKLELKGEGGALESPEELPHRVKIALRRIMNRIEVIKNGGDFDVRDEQFIENELLDVWEHHSILPSADVPVEPPTQRSDYDELVAAYPDVRIWEHAPGDWQVAAGFSGEIKTYGHKTAGAAIATAARRIRAMKEVPADVPVEERTLEEIWTCDACMTCDPEYCKCGTKPVPERTAEMERLFKKVIMATYDLWDSDQDSKVGKRLRALAGLLPGYDRDIDTLLDHIEGKAK